MLSSAFKSTSTPDLTVIKETYRLSLFGDGYVGKTEIIRRFIHDKYLEDYKPTVEEFYETTYDFKGVSLSLEIVDTSGTDQFPAMRELNINKSDLVILVYDVTRKSTEKEIYRLYDIVRSFSLCPIIIVGAKGDMVADMYAYKNKAIRKLLQNVNDHALYHVVCSAKEDSRSIHRVFEIGFRDLIPEIDLISNDLLQREHLTIKYQKKR